MVRTSGLLSSCDLSENVTCGVDPMDKAKLVSGIAKIASAGEKAGFTVEQMIALLDAGIGIETY
jgi:hypothetical protein